MHPLLRDVLLTHFEALPEAERRRVHVAAWHWFAGCGMPHDAVHHALRAGEVHAAADLVEASATELFVKGELRQLVGLVRQLPEAIVHERAGLRLWVAWGQVYERRLDDCARSIAQLQQDMAGAAPVERYRLTLLRGLHAVQRDDTAAAMAILPELIDAPDDADGIALTGRRNLLTWIHLYRGDYEMRTGALADLCGSGRCAGSRPAPAVGRDRRRLGNTEAAHAHAHVREASRVGHRSAARTLLDSHEAAARCDRLRGTDPGLCRCRWDSTACCGDCLLQQLRFHLLRNDSRHGTRA